MSLLMDALKKAEQAKQAGLEASAGEPGLRLEPVGGDAAADSAAAQPGAGRNLPDLPPQLEILDAEFMAHAESAKPTAAEKPAPRPAPSASTPAASPRPAPAAAHATREAAPAAKPRTAAAADAGRTAAQQLFTAKKPERSRVGFYVSAGAVFVLGAAAIGGYVWWELQPKAGLARPGVAMNMPRPLTPAPAAPPPAGLPAAQPAIGSAAPAAAAPVLAAAATPARAAQDGAEIALPPRQRAAAPRPAEADSPIRVTKSRLVVNPGASRGFEALNAGDLETARTEYQQLLQAEPKNGDALRGLAAVALRQGDAAAAVDWYIKALEADPRDAQAQAGLIGLRGHGGEPGDPLALESRLKTLIATQPDVAALHFALGNIYARQSRWNDAQQSFFKAFSAEPEHPDYVFNLAVSLDHLRQPRLAAQYYNQALALAAQRPAGFDKAQVATRLRDLQQ